MARTPNAERSERTRSALVATAREIFADDGYAATSTPAIAAAATVTRGALYHHFADKADLFRTVVEHEQAAVAREIDAASDAVTDPIKGIRVGGEAFLAAMRDPGRRRILLVDGPAVLGVAAMREIDADHAGRTLVQAVTSAVDAGRLPPWPVRALADLLDAMFDRVALLDAEDEAHREALWALLDRLATDA